MVTEPNIDKDNLKYLIQGQYGIKISNLIFNPKGWASWSYIVETIDGEKYFLKIYKDATFHLKAFEFTNKLSTKCGIKNISYPVNTSSGKISLDFNGYEIVLFNYISGITSSEEKLSNGQLEKLGELLAKIHKSKDIIGSYFKVEDFEDPHKRQVINILNKVDRVRPKNDYQHEAKELYLKYKYKFLNELEVLDQLKGKLKDLNLEFVNCHGEPSPDNIMISNNEIYLIDWDFPLFAPKEKDLLFFNTRYDQVLKGYAKVSSDISINKDAESFYGHLWNAQEISDYGTELLLNEISEEEYIANLKELKNFLNYSGLAI